MNKSTSSNRFGTAVVILLSFLLFYFPPVINLLLQHKGPPGIDGVNLLLATVYSIIFFVNYFILIPGTLFGNGRNYWFYVVNFLMIASGLCIIPLWFALNGDVTRHHIPDSTFTAVIEHIGFSIRDSVMMILAISLAYALQFSRERERLQRRELELSVERRRIELRGLKMQLNPHFLFNSLNNIYSLISISPSRAQEALHDLSGMLRYMIYDASSSGVPLEKETAFIEDYVRLMKLRTAHSTDVSCEITSETSETLVIAPLLFLTLVENAFKHVSPHNGCSLISIRIHKGTQYVECKVTNSCAYNEGNTETPDGSGVGIKNIKRQLDLLYPEKSSLSFKEEEGLFSAVLIIDNSALSPC